MTRLHIITNFSIAVISYRLWKSICLYFRSVIESEEIQLNHNYTCLQLIYRHDYTDYAFDFVNYVIYIEMKIILVSFKI